MSSTRRAILNWIVFVAIKMILGVDASLLKRFEVEARSTASLQHPNIVTIYDFGDQEGSALPGHGVPAERHRPLSPVISSGQPLSLASKLQHLCPRYLQRLAV